MFSTTAIRSRASRFSGVTLAVALLAFFASGAQAAEQRIIGGERADVSYPWMAALLERDRLNEVRGFTCGGTMIAKKWMLTAAHCVENYWGDGVVDLDYYDVKVGAVDLKDPSEAHERIAIRKIVVHPDYFKFGYPDLALVRLVKSGTQTPIEMASPGSAAESPGYLSTVTGWGVTDVYGYEAERYLREVTVPVVSHEKCDYSYRELEYIYDSHMICAGVGERDSCSGDSGGPMFVTDPSTGQSLQTGIVAFGEGCADPDYPGVYTRVSTFKDWIFATIGKIDVSADANSLGELEAHFDVSCDQLTCAVNAEHSSEGGAPLVQWRWTFGDGSLEYGPAATHTFEDPGTYRVKLTVMDATGQTHKTLRTITVFTASDKNPKIQDVFKGSIGYSFDTVYAPGEWGFYASDSKIRATLSHDTKKTKVFLEEFDFATAQWETVEISTRFDDEEYLTYRPARLGLFRWRILAKRGEGSYRLESSYRFDGS